MNSHRPFDEWIGRNRIDQDVIEGDDVERLAATLDWPLLRPAAGGPLPLPWHWIFFRPKADTAVLSVDGHEPRGDFIPPFPHARRMWAGSRVEVHADGLRVGDEIERKTTITRIETKQGRSGELVFLTLQHAYYAGGKYRLLDTQEIVYRHGDTAVSATPVRPMQSAEPLDLHNADAVETVRFDNTLLFRYSALSFNSHRIHYDLDYARVTENYAGIVVHGPLIVTRLLMFFYQQYPQQPVVSFTHRSMKPLIANEPCRLVSVLHGPEYRLFAINESDVVLTEVQLKIQAK